MKIKRTVRFLNDPPAVPLTLQFTVEREVDEDVEAIDDEFFGKVRLEEPSMNTGTDRSPMEAVEELRDSEWTPSGESLREFADGIDSCGGRISLRLREWWSETRE